jgi:hypothetical protein
MMRVDYGRYAASVTASEKWQQAAIFGYFRISHQQHHMSNRL